MSLEDLEREITASSEKKASELSSEARLRRDSILAAARSSAKEANERAKLSAEKEAKRMEEEAESALKIERDNAVYSAIGALTRHYMEKAERLTAARLAKEYHAKLLSISIASLDETFKGYDKGDIKVEADGESVKLLEKQGYNPSVSKSGGIFARTKDGSVVFDATIASLVRKSKAAIRNRLANEFKGEASRFLALKTPSASQKPAAPTKRHRRGRPSKRGAGAR